VLVQAMAMGQLKDLQELREVVRASFPIETYEPEGGATWREAFEIFKQLKVS
jgi:rhamnulokinase